MARELIKTIKDERQNYLINGAMEISQRGTSFAAVANNTYTLDRFIYRKTGAMVHTISQNTDVPNFAQSGYVFKNSMFLNLTTQDTSIAAGDYCFIEQAIEGYNFSNFAQKPFTLGFWVKSSQVGTYCVAFRNEGLDRSYVSEYMINASNTWEYKTITVSLGTPASGTWNYTNGTGLFVSWVLAAGTTYQAPAGSWQSGNFLATSNQANATNTASTSFRITGVTINQGLTPIKFKTFQEDFGSELNVCRRYFERIGQFGNNTQLGGGVTAAANTAIGAVNFKVTKRANPATPTASATNGFRFNNATSNYVSSAVTFQSTTPYACAILLTISLATGNIPGTLDIISSNYIDVDAELA